MSYVTRYEESIIRAASEAARMARLHGCVIDVETSSRFGKRIHVRIEPNREPQIDPEETRELRP